MKLTASKMSRSALASVDSGRSTSTGRREGRIDRVGALVGVLVVVASGRVGRSVNGVGGTWVARVARVGTAGKGSGSCESGKDESRDDFELHIVCFLLWC